MILYRWMRTLDSSKKAHLVMYSDWSVEYTICGSALSGKQSPALQHPRCRRCSAMAKRLKVELRA